MNNEKKGRGSFIAILVLVLVLGISIGYAALSTTLNINGSTTIGKSSWDVHFANVIETAGGVTATKAAAITAGQKKTAKVRVEYNKDVTAAQLPTTDQVLTLTASMNFIQA